jgi:hypothetical protein
LGKNNGPICEIIESYDVLEEQGNQTVEINKVAWNSRPPKIDIRRWDHGKEDGPVALKGVTLTDEACERLAIKLLELGYGDLREVKRVFDERKRKK